MIYYLSNPIELYRIDTSSKIPAMTEFKNSSQEWLRFLGKFERMSMWFGSEPNKKKDTIQKKEN